MKARPTFCVNNSRFIEHIKIDLDAETKEDKKSLDLLCQAGIATANINKASSAVIYLPVKKEILFP
ncbi:MAG: hypothetical protein WC475_03035 [Candidatus Paceibacterota bacterium]